jgi:hypothetical protein
VNTSFSLFNGEARFVCFRRKITLMKNIKQKNLRRNLSPSCFEQIQGDQQESKSRVLPHLLFYRNVFLSLIVHICILAIHSNFIGCLSLEKFIIN